MELESIDRMIQQWNVYYGAINRLDVLRWLMHGRDMSWRDVSRASGLHYQTLMKIAGGQRGGSDATWQALFDAMQITDQEQIILGYPTLYERLKGSRPSAEVYVLYTIFDGFPFFYDFTDQKPETEFSLHLKWEEAEALFRKQNPERIIKNGKNFTP